MNIQSSEEWSPISLVLSDGRRMRSRTVKYWYDDWREYHVEGIGLVRCNFGKVWFGPHQWFISSGDSAMVTCDPMLEMMRRDEPPKTLWQRLISLVTKGTP